MNTKFVSLLFLACFVVATIPSGSQVLQTAEKSIEKSLRASSQQIFAEARNLPPPPSMAVSHSFDPLEDSDGDRIPNLWEDLAGTDMDDASDFPASDIVVAADGSGDYTTLQAAWDAAGDGFVILVKSGTYEGYAGYNDPKSILWLGERGISPPRIIQPDGWWWWSAITAINGALAFDNFIFDAPMHGPALNVCQMQVRLSNCLFRGIRVIAFDDYDSNSRLLIEHCTGVRFEADSGNSWDVAIFPALANVEIKNSILWSESPYNEISHTANPTITDSVVRGHYPFWTYDINALLTLTGWLKATSPAIGMCASSNLAFDIHGQARPALLADAGCDQWTDSDSDDLPDWWEKFYLGGHPYGTQEQYMESCIWAYESGEDMESDSDGDGICDWAEWFVYGTFADWADSDNDGLDDYEEIFQYSTKPQIQDSDEDGLWDGEEVLIYDTNPLIYDTDGDGLGDGDELFYWVCDPLEFDSDDDGISDGMEVYQTDTYPDIADNFLHLLQDSDGDRLPDLWEYLHRTNPRDNHSFVFADIVVAADGTGDFMTLQEAADAAWDGAIIFVNSCGGQNIQPGGGQNGNYAGFSVAPTDGYHKRILWLAERCWIPPVIEGDISILGTWGVMDGFTIRPSATTSPKLDFAYSNIRLVNCQVLGLDEPICNDNSKYTEIEHCTIIKTAGNLPAFTHRCAGLFFEEQHRSRHIKWGDGFRSRHCSGSSDTTGTTRSLPSNIAWRPVGRYSSNRRREKSIAITAHLLLANKRNSPRLARSLYSKYHRHEQCRSTSHARWLVAKQLARNRAVYNNNYHIRYS